MKNTMELRYGDSEYSVILKDAQKDTIHIALSPWNLTDDYNRHAGVTFLSFLDHCPKNAKVTAHILYDEKLCVGKEKETNYNKQCYLKIAERYNCEVIFHHVELPSWTNNLPAVKKWTPGTLMRLYLPELLPNVHKILYLDCDMVVLTEIGNLWKIPLKEESLAACIDTDIGTYPPKRKRQNRKLNLPIENYFCAGILLMNLGVLRERNFVQKAFSYLQEHPGLLYLDQDILNWFCQGEYKELDEKYNIYAYRKDVTEYLDDCIIHYAAKEKPWKRYGGKVDDAYWRYLIETPWCENKNDMLQYVRDAPDISKAFEALPRYWNVQEGVGYVDIGKKVLKLLICLPLNMWTNIISYIYYHKL